MQYTPMENINLDFNNFQLITMKKGDKYVARKKIFKFK